MWGFLFGNRSYLWGGMVKQVDSPKNSLNSLTQPTLFHHLLAFFYSSLFLPFPIFHSLALLLTLLPPSSILHPPPPKSETVRPRGFGHLDFVAPQLSFPRPWSCHMVQLFSQRQLTVSPLNPAVVVDRYEGRLIGALCSVLRSARVHPLSCVSYRHRHTLLQCRKEEELQ